MQCIGQDKFEEGRGVDEGRGTRMLMLVSIMVMLMILVLMVFRVGKARCARDEADRAGLLLHIQAAPGIQFANCLRLVVTNDDE